MHQTKLGFAVVLFVPMSILAGCSDDAGPEAPAPAPTVANGATPPPPAAATPAAPLPAPTKEEGATSEKDDGAPPPVSYPPHTDFIDPPANPQVIAQYNYLDPTHVVPKKLLDHAVTYYDANKNLITNLGYMTVVDFTAHSGKRRFFIIDMKTGAVTPIVVAHGKMSDPDYTGYATEFSNVEGSNMSSLGFALTAETYYGTHGRSLRLHGLSSTNDNMLPRAIVIHGASYVVEGQAKQGRSLGCFALDEDEKDDVIDKLEGGSLLYADLS